MKDEEKYLEDEMEKFGERWPYPASFDGYDKDWVDDLAEECAKHFYELGKQAMKEQDEKELSEKIAGAYQLGLSDKEKQMMNEAEETDLYWDGDFLAIDLNMAALGYSEHDKVRVIVCKKED